MHTIRTIFETTRGTGNGRKNDLLSDTVYTWGKWRHSACGI